MLCSYVEYDADERPFSLNEPFHTVHIEPDANGQLAASELMLYVQMTDEDASGTFDFAIEVRTDTNVVIRNGRTNAERITFYSRYHPARAFEHVFLLRGLVFPAPGVYHFHVMCGHASLSDRPNAVRPARLRVVRHEPNGGSP